MFLNSVHHHRGSAMFAAALLPMLAIGDLLAADRLPVAPVVCKDLKTATRQMAAEAAKIVRGQKGQSLEVLPLSGPPRATGGAVIASGLRDMLPKVMLDNPGVGSLGLIGHYRLKKDKTTGAMSVLIEAQVTDSMGEPLASLTPCLLRDAASVRALTR